jgi:alpha-aminoadipic semialdehyde synthase
MPYVRHLLGLTQPNPDLVGPIEASLDRATIVTSGKLKGEYKWLQKPVDDWRKTHPRGTFPSSPGVQSGALKERKRILLLGSGLVAGPAVEVLAARQDVTLCIGQSQHILDEHYNGSSCSQ